ncbi:DUF697 domain-containing protein [cf. Phormidesmis sp. LEGE 11477]|uniref:slr1306 family protein n=1 Tax=cf. Phormidesmis sp. LEGE 11477 TaxID=1828680 RepID=UPI001881F2D1|nr:DUF697 domain-containing protein [cf. Phormidesmis sp. LEGE 11477]MBE9062152.1 DUF697 domain-containing protein [cf. Phormidesmis sp. LEGE 11477]
MQLKRPILVGGLGLSASLWLLNIVGHSPVGHALGDSTSLLSVVAVGAGLWLFNKSRGSSVVVEPPLAIGPVDRSAIEGVIAKTESIFETLISELSEEVKADKTQSIWSQIEEKRKAINHLLANLERESLAFAVVGNKSVGKTTLVSELKDSWQASQPTVKKVLEVSGEEMPTAADADLVLFMTAGDLTQSELQRIHALIRAGYRLQVVLNKQDQMLPADRQSVLQQIQTRVEDLGIGVSAIVANPAPIKVRRHKENGDVEEFTEQPAPQLAKLTAKLDDLVEHETQQLVLATALRQAKALQVEVQQLLNTQRKQRALPIVEQMQWIAAGSAFASPLPSLDLLASTAINSQLILDLGKVYGQTFSLEQAKKAASTLAELLVKLGLVELSTQAFGSLLKAHVATYIAGGAIQGVSAAYLTRTVGLSLIEFFEEQSLLPEKERKFAFAEMGERLQTLFKATKQGMGLQAFLQQALSHLPIKAAA